MPPDWVELLKPARKKRKWTQGQVAEALGVKQSLISQLENHDIARSKYVEPLCMLYGLDPPSQPSPNEFDRRWADAGLALRMLDDVTFLALLHSTEATLRAAQKKSQHTDRVR